MKFFKKLKEKLFSTSSKIGSGLDEIIDSEVKDSKKMNEPNSILENVDSKGSELDQSVSSSKTKNGQKLHKKNPEIDKEKKPGFIRKILSSVDTISRRRRLDY